MRNFLLTIFCLTLSTGLLASQDYTMDYHPLSGDKAALNFSLQNYVLNPVELNGTAYTQIVFSGSVVTKDKGYAELPFLSASLQIAPDKNYEVQVLESVYTDIQLSAPLVPSRGILYRDQNPDEVPYAINPASLNDQWYPESLFEQKEPFIIRDFRGTTVMVYPFRYNAITQTLRVYTSVTLEITGNNDAPTNVLRAEPGKIYREMQGIYKSLFLNYSSEKQDLTVNEAGDILVIATERDLEAIQPYIDWKKEKGHEVFLETVATGTNVVDLIQTLYDANPEILYVQLVGDWTDIKVNTLGGSPMDPMAGCVIGSDVFPDICIGRFSANNPAELTVQVEKTINYEKNPESGAIWYESALGIGSSEGATNGDDNEMDKTHIQIIYDNKLDPFSYNTYFPNYDPGANATTVGNNINEGVSLINYCGHGSNTSWGTTGFNNNNINALTNGSMLPGIISVACVNGAYHSGTCFAEAWLRKSDGGALVTLMATINQPWQPPMRGQDYMNDVLTGGYDYTVNPGNGINTTEGRTTFGSIVANGLVLMYSESQGGDDLETLQTWVTFGDASVQMRTAPPAVLEISNNIVLVGTPFEATITSEGAPAHGALVSLSGNNLFYSAYTDQNGYVSIDNELIPGDVQLVVTAFNTETIYETISCIPPDGPYVIFGQKEVIDENGNGLLEYGETASLHITMKNVGIEVAENVEVVLSTSDEFVTLTNEVASFGDIPAGGEITVENAFSFEVSEMIPDEHGIAFDLISTDGTETWTSKCALTGYAPVLLTGNFSVNDATGNNNGRLDAGETAEVSITVLNNGHAVSQPITASLTTTSVYLTVLEGASQCDPVHPEEAGTLVFTVAVDDETPIGTTADFLFTAEAGTLSLEKTFFTTMGLILEDFETGDFTAFNWHFSGSDWSIENTDPFEGQYSVKSATIPDNQSTAMTLDYNVMADDTISFYYKVSSEANYDYLRFYIDGVKKAEWSGNVTWSRYATPVTAGFHTFKWEYVKDYMVSGGSDCAWIDYIIFPPEMRTIAYAGEDDWVCNGEDYLLQPNVANFTSLIWTTSGTGTFDDPTLENATYTPSVDDVAAGNVVITLTVTGMDEEEYMDQLMLAFGNTPEVEAGEDQIICAGSTLDILGQATWYESLEWTTSGDGTFSDANAIETTYTPGENDLASGSATLVLMAYSQCGNVSDFTTVTLSDGPEIPAAIQGEVQACGTTSGQYTSEGSTDATAYRWQLKPSEAGVLNEQETSVTITWANHFTGEAEIKLIASNECGNTESDPVLITVTGLPVLPERVDGADSVDVYKVADTEYQIDAILNTTGYRWKVEPNDAGSTEATENIARITWNPDFVGLAHVTVCGINECGEGEFAPVKVVKIYNSVGIVDYMAEKWNLYPNPAQNELFVEGALLDEAYTVTVYNTLGASIMIYSRNHDMPGMTILDVSALENGLYYIALKTQNGTSLKKVLIHR
ncbi:MAG TPA: C25 family cysteine peptidase [Bacteroidales bacterium]|nr:C25 family cysteine peptidase [Bacteroidales bacterium]